MPVKFYMDVHIPRSITNGLRRLNVDVLTAQEDKAITLPDNRLLTRATQLGRTLYSQDDDLLAEAARRLKAKNSFSGVIYSHQLNSPIGKIVQDMELIAKACEAVEMQNQIVFLPF